MSDLNSLYDQHKRVIESEGFYIVDCIDSNWAVKSEDLTIADYEGFFYFIFDYEEGLYQ